jgi:hypothetical protein
MMACQGTFHIIYETDNLPGNSLQPTGGNHSPVENKMVYLPISFPTAVKEVNNVSIEVGQNRPNPATTKTMIEVKAPRGNVELSIVNMLGQEIYSTEKVSNGTGVQFTVNVEDFNTGVYFYTVKFGENSVTKKMIVK